jgi:hypothetical protein
MPSPVPTPVAAALGLVPAVLGGVRRLPGKAVQLPVYAVSHALTSIGAARQGYDDLAERGERLIARLRGTSFDEVEDRVEDALQGTALAKPYDRVEDALEDATETVTGLVRSTGARARKATGTATRAVGSSLSAAADTVQESADEVDPPAKAPTKAPAKAATPAKAAPAKATPAKAAKKAAKSGGEPADPADPDAAAAAVARAEQVVAEAAARAEEAAAEAAEAAQAAGVDPDQAERERKNPEQAAKGSPTPQATQPESTRIDTAASPDVVETVEQLTARIGGVVLEHDQLPLPDYDHLTLGSLRGRIRSLDLPQLVQLRDYEKAKADRLPIVTMLDNRIAKLAQDPTAPLSGSAPAKAAEAPDKPKPAKAGSKVDPTTGGPKQNPPSQGDPTNPGQPRGSGSGSTNPNNPTS